MYGLDRRIENKLIQEAISSGLGRELREDGTLGDRVFEVNKDTVDIQLIEDTPRQKEEKDYLRHRFIDDIIRAFIPGCEPINPLYVRATFYLAVGLCTGYLAYKSNQNLGHAPHPHPNPPVGGVVPNVQPNPQAAAVQPALPPAGLAGAAHGQNPQAGAIVPHQAANPPPVAQPQVNPQAAAGAAPQPVNPAAGAQPPPANWQVAVLATVFGGVNSSNLFFVENYLLAETGRIRIREGRYICRLKSGLEPKKRLEPKSRYLRSVDTEIRYLEKRDNNPDGSVNADANFFVCDGSVAVTSPPLKPPFNKGVCKYSVDDNDNITLFNQISKVLDSVERASKNEQKRAALEGVKLVLNNLLDQTHQRTVDHPEDKEMDPRVKKAADKIVRIITKLGIDKDIREPSMIDDAKEFLNESLPNLKTLQGKKPTVFFIGPTRSGKSVLVNRLMGNKLVKVAQDKLELHPDVLRQKRDPTNPHYAYVGSSDYNSETRFVTAYKSKGVKNEDLPLMLADCPGFGNNDSFAKERDDFSLHLATQMNIDLRGIVIVVESSVIFGGAGGKTLIDLIDDLASVLPDGEDGRALRDHLLFVVNVKSEVHCKPEDVISKLKGLKERDEKIVNDHHDLVGRLSKLEKEEDIDAQESASEGEIKLKTRGGRVIASKLLEDRARYQGAERRSRLLKLLVRDKEDSQLDLIVGNVNNEDVLAKISKKLSEFKPINPKEGKILRFNPEPYQKRLQQYIKHEVQDLEDKRIELKKLQEDMEQLERSLSKNSERIQSTGRKIKALAEKINSIEAKLKTYREDVVHKNLCLTGSNQAWLSYYPYYYVEGYDGVFESIKFSYKNSFVAADGTVFELRTDEKACPSAKKIPSKTVKYQATSAYGWSRCPSESPVTVTGPKALHVEHMMNFDKFRTEDVIGFCKFDKFDNAQGSLRRFLAKNIWLQDVDKEMQETIDRLKHYMGVFDGRDKLSFVSTGIADFASYIDEVMPSISQIQIELNRLNSLYLDKLQNDPNAIERRLKQDQADTEESLINTKRAYENLSSEVTQCLELFSTTRQAMLDLKKLLGNSPCFDFALDALDPVFDKRPVSNPESSKVYSINETASPQAATGVAAGLAAAAGSLLSWMKQSGERKSSGYRDSTAAHDAVPLLSQPLRRPLSQLKPRAFVPPKRLSLLPEAEGVVGKGMAPFFKALPAKPSAGMIGPLRTTLNMMRRVVK